jgi:hypothetical protein
LGWALSVSIIYVCLSLGSGGLLAWLLMLVGVVLRFSSYWSVLVALLFSPVGLLWSGIYTPSCDGR